MNPTPPSPVKADAPGGALATFCIVTSGSILFCSKGVVAKLSYAHGLDPISVLNLRMMFSLPLFAAIVLFTAGGFPQLRRRDWAQLALLGFFGYYLSSLVNFSGLQYVSVGLERIILFTYPTIVLCITALFLRRRVVPLAWLAAAVAWTGILFAFGGEARAPVAGGNLPLGASLVFASALIYAVFIISAGDAIRRVGPLLFAGIAVGFSCVFMMVHFVVVHPAEEMFSYPSAVYIHALILAVFGTVAPALLMSLGLKRAGPQRFAVMGALGPVATLFLAWAILNEQPNALQALGLVFALAGGVAIAFLKNE